MSDTAPNTYKATIIFDTRGYQDTVDSLIDKLKEVLTSINCRVLHAENLGQKEFARVTDKKFPSAYYAEVGFEGTAESPSLFKDKLRLDKTIERIFVQRA